MEGSQNDFSMPYWPTGRPSSPFATSGMRFPSTVNHSPQIPKRMGQPSLFRHPCHLDHIEPIGKGPQFHYTRPQSRNLSSRPSSASGRAGSASASATSPASPADSGADFDEPMHAPHPYTDPRPERPPPTRVIDLDGAGFELEEYDDDDGGSAAGINESAEVVRPDQIEDATSDPDHTHASPAHATMVDRFRHLNCSASEESEESEDEDEIERRRCQQRRKKKKRWSAGVCKRTYSQSVEGDTDAEDADRMDGHRHDGGACSRRLRRRVRGPGDRSSLIFEDIPPPNVAEEVPAGNDGRGGEPDSASGMGPPSLPSDQEAFTRDALPLWVLQDPMEVDSEASQPPSVA